MRVLVAAALVALVALPANAQNSAEEVFDAMIDAFESRMAGVDDYTVVSDAFTSYHRRTGPPGATRFETATTSNLGGMGIGNMTTRFSTDNPHRMKELYASGSSLVGTGDFGGAAVHILEVDPAVVAQGDMESLTMYVEIERSVLRGLRIQAREDAAEGSQEIVIHFEDYRDDDGMLYAYRSRIVMPNPDVNVDAEQVERAREALAQIEERMASMPEAQREQMQRMMASQIERMEKLAGGGDLETVYEVTELRVNSGIDPAVFTN